MEEIPQSIKNVKVYPPPIPVQKRATKKPNYKEDDEGDEQYEDDDEFDPADYSDSIEDEEVDDNDDAFDSNELVDHNNNNKALNDSCQRLRGFSIADEEDVVETKHNSQKDWCKSFLKNQKDIEPFVDETGLKLPSSTLIETVDLTKSCSPPHSPLVIQSFKSQAIGKASVESQSFESQAIGKASVESQSFESQAIGKASVESQAVPSHAKNSKSFEPIQQTNSANTCLYQLPPASLFSSAVKSSKVNSENPIIEKPLTIINSQAPQYYKTQQQQQQVSSLEQPTQITNFSISLQPSQQPPLPHTSTHAQSYLPAVVQQQPMVVHSKVARSQPKSSTLSASEVAFFRISDKIDTFASQLTSINTTKSNNDKQQASSSNVSRIASNLDARIFNNIFKRKLEKAFTLASLMSQPLEHFVINAPEDIHKIFGEYS